MQSRRFTLILMSALAALACAGASNATARPSHMRILLFDAIVTYERTAGPAPNQVGHEQIVSGVLRNSRRDTIGRFAFTCTWTRVTSDGAVESCVASGYTRDGQLNATGPARSNSTTQHWKVNGGTGAYRTARGSLLVRDLGARESLITATVETETGAVLHAGVLSRPAANRRFIARADQLCRQADHRLGALPPFPFHQFDPLHPNPSLLPQVGAFFTGSGDPRPILYTLDADLHVLDLPPANRRAWTKTLRALRARLSVINWQDQAALAADVPSFVRTVHASAANFRDVAIAATAFGATRCSF
jgi:hypothetical protein